MNGYHLEWWKALTAGVVVSLTTWAFQRLLPGRKVAPYLLGAVVGAALLVLASFVSWSLAHR